MPFPDEGLSALLFLGVVSLRRGIGMTYSCHADVLNDSVDVHAPCSISLGKCSVGNASAPEPEQVWHLCQEDGKSFEKVILSIHSNGFSIRTFA